MSEDLKPCPFCGGEAYIKVESDSFSNIQSIIRCSECCTTMVVDVDMTKSDDWNKQKAIEKWNKRHSLWHTGTPTEDGTFIVLWEDTEEQVKRYSKLHFNEYNNTWYDEETLCCNWGDEGHARVIAWMRVEPYKEENK